MVAFTGTEIISADQPVQLLEDPYLLEASHYENTPIQIQCILKILTS